MNLLSSATVFSFFTLISRLLGYIRDILIATFLGASIYADAFFVAFRLPNTFRRLFAEGTFNAAFIPSYSKEKIRGKKNGKILIKTFSGVGNEEVVQMAKKNFSKHIFIKPKSSRKDSKELYLYCIL